MAQYVVHLYSDTASAGKRDFISFTSQQYYWILCGEAEDTRFCQCLGPENPDTRINIPNRVIFRVPLLSGCTALYAYLSYVLL